MGGLNFDPEKDIPDLSGKVIFITGGTTGLGKESILALAKHHPEHIYFSGRDHEKAAAVINEVQSFSETNVTFIECDLASLASVQRAVKEFNSTSARLDVLMCNAGVMALPPGLTTDGYEVHFGTNHLGHALLVKLLLPTLIQTVEQVPNSDVRIVFLTSIGFRAHWFGGIAFETLRTPQDFPIFGSWIRYAQSKLANIVYAAELARRYPRITTVSVHPGVAATNLVGSLPFLKRVLVYVTNPGQVKSSATEIVANQLWAATATGDKENEKIVNGAFYEPVAVLGTHDWYSKSEEFAGRLWDWTQKELEGYSV
ncbi:hypothetical protein MMC22_010848 [Lobaria immixta]|nr:hypothetical protein [Lobaria immixta]